MKSIITSKKLPPANPPNKSPKRRIKFKYSKIKMEEPMNNEYNRGGRTVVERIANTTTNNSISSFISQLDSKSEINSNINKQHIFNLPTTNAKRKQRKTNRVFICKTQQQFILTNQN